MVEPIHFLVFCEKTAFFRFKDIFGECFLYRETSPMIEPAVCLHEEGTCHVGKGCMETLAKRVYVLFEEVLPRVELIILYYRRRNIPGIGAGIFWRDMREPRITPINPYAWNVVKSRGTVFRFDPGPSFFLTGQAPPPEPIDEKVAETALD
jgi:hypothetical protein